ncbi:ATP-binding protein [Rhodococcus sp. X156]|uniref:ATP-binding protein n=1 Tax=Rhodococcus sp. X156 TaxID=2499145 RepID=UPI001F49DED0|nr:ATP-binding protein [Rhodococcus sp. X156]
MPTATSTPALRRRTGARVIGGVAGGVAEHLGVDVFRVRVVFVLLAALGGAGVVGYGLLWIFTRPGDDVAPAPPGERRRALGLAVIGLALAGVMSMLLSGSAGALAPLLVISVGAALVWQEADAGRGLRTRPKMLTLARVVAGVTLVVVGFAVVVLGQLDLGALRAGVLAVLATLLGVALLSVPFWLRLARDLAEERRVRIRSEERADIASHLHDSVLQTLALIQKQAHSPTEVSRLARAQERDLRSWLFSEESSDDPAAPTLAACLRAVAAEVEDDHGVTIRPVIVGDADLTAELRALCAAAREAMVNAAKHAGVQEVDVFAEVEEQRVSVFVRDRGKGFDPEAVAADRHGLQRSVHDRMVRHGGTAEVISAPGRGTEVRLGLPLGTSDD